MTERTFDARTVLGFDPLDPDFHADPYAHYRALRAAGPIQRTPSGVWLSPSYGTCASVLRDPRFGHEGGQRENATLRNRPAPGERTPSFLVLDPPDHTRLRRLVSKAFTARLVERLRSRVEGLVGELLDTARGDVDLISALAYPLPVIVISELLGVPPADHDRFKAWSDALARGLDPEFLLPPEEIARRNAARDEFAGYFRELAAERRAHPRDDLLSALVKVEEQGDVLSEAELLATCVLLLVAGHETTVNLIGNGTLALLRHPDQLAYFRENPDAAPAVVEELLRYDPPVQLSGRVSLDDVEIGGEKLQRGEIILLLIGAANRDPSVFPDPDRLDLTRTPLGATGSGTTGSAATGHGHGGDAQRHLAFGLGIHFCLGAPLARLEGQVALTELVRRDLTLLTDRPEYRDNVILRGLASLPVHIG